MAVNHPLVSIIIPSFNRANVLPRAIESSLNQTYDNIEIIVVDDGSTDNTPEMMKKYQNKVDYIRFDQNRGANAARNKGIKHACGRFISFLDSDDEYPRDNIKTKVEILKNLPTSCAGVFTPYKQYKNGQLWRVSEYNKKFVDIDVLKHSNVIGGFSSITVEKSIFDEVGYLDESLPSSQDYDFYLRLTKMYSLMYLDKTYVNRYSGDTRIGFDSERKIEGNKKILNKHNSTLSPRRRARQHSALAIILGRNKKSTEAKRHFKQSISQYPYELRSYPLYFVAQFGDSILFYIIRLLDYLISLKSRIKTRLYLFKSTKFD